MSKRIPLLFTALAITTCSVPLLPAEDSLPYRQRDFRGTSMPGANLAGADLTDAGFDQANLSNANLSGAEGRRTLFRGADLSGADLSGAQLQRAQFSDARARAADFSGADLAEASFANADLTGANFNRAKLDGTDFRGANLDGATFDRARSGRAIFDRQPDAQPAPPDVSISPPPAPEPPAAAQLNPPPPADGAVPAAQPTDEPRRRPLIGRILWPFGGNSNASDEDQPGPDSPSGDEPDPAASEPPVPQQPAQQPEVAPLERTNEQALTAEDEDPQPSRRPLLARVLWPFGGRDNSGAIEEPLSEQPASEEIPGEETTPAGTPDAAPDDVLQAPLPAVVPVAEPSTDATIFVTTLVQPGGLPERGLRLELYDIERERVIDAERTDREGAARFRVRSGRSYILRPMPRGSEPVSIEPSELQFQLGPEGADVRFSIRYMPPGGELRSGIQAN